jgi:hypothetical protein
MDYKRTFHYAYSMSVVLRLKADIRTHQLAQCSQRRSKIASRDFEAAQALESVHSLYLISGAGLGGP